MATDPTTSTDPFELHCGICQHVYFQDDWTRTPYCSLHGREVDVRSGDVCSEFVEGANPSGDDESGWELEESELDVDETESLGGTTGPFYAVYLDDTRETWYCSNCDSTDVAVGPMGRLKCNGCGNVHRSTEWDSAYL